MDWVSLSTLQVCLITDCMGSIVAYDILSSHPHTLSSSPTSPSPARSLGKPLQHPSPLSSPHSSPITPTMQPRKYSKSFSEVRAHTSPTLCTLTIDDL